MPSANSNALRETLKTVAGRIKRYGSKGINEQDTKATLIQPVLRALGWDVEDLEDVQREYKRRRQDKPVDYAVFLLRTPCLFVEAKALGQNLDDRRWANQIMGYASVAGVEWVVLTDGREYRLFNSHATVPVEEKLFRDVRVDDDLDDAAEVLRLLSKERMSENEINVLWKAHFVDRQVKAVVQSLFEGEPDPSILRLLKRRLDNLTLGDIRASLQRAEIRFDFPVKAIPDTPKVGVQRPKSKATAPARQDGRRRGLIYLSDIIEAGLITAPLELCCHYKGRDLRALVQSDGRVEFQGELHGTPSTAAEFARASVTGRRMQTNGWTFWHFRDRSGELVELDTARQAYKQKSK